MSHVDAQIGRIVDAVDELGLGDDTLIMVLSDNGASAEGGPHGTLQRVRVHARVRRDRQRHGRRSASSSAASASTTTTRGVGRGRATRRSGCGSATRGWAARARRWSCVGRDGIADRRRGAPAVLPRGRPDADVLLELGRRQRTPGAGRRHEPGQRRFEDAEFARATRTQYFEMLGSRSVYRRRLEGHDRPRDHRRRSEKASCSRAAATTRPTTGACSTSRRDFSESTDLSGRNRSCVASMIDDVVGRGRAQPGAAAHRGVVRRDDQRRPGRRDRRRATAHLCVPSGHLAGARGRVPEPRGRFLVDRRI